MNFRPYHNPENIDESLVPDGWRFRYADETNLVAQTQCTAFLFTTDQWDHELNWNGTCPGLTYIVPVNS